MLLFSESHWAMLDWMTNASTVLQYNNSAIGLNKTIEKLITGVVLMAAHTNAIFSF